MEGLSKRSADRGSEVWIGGLEQLDIDFCILAHVAFEYVFHLAIDFSSFVFWYIFYLDIDFCILAHVALEYIFSFGH